MKNDKWRFVVGTSDFDLSFVIGHRSFVISSLVAATESTLEACAPREHELRWARLRISTYSLAVYELRGCAWSSGFSLHEAVGLSRAD